MSSLLPEEFKPLLRGSVLGELEGFCASGGITGWACSWPEESDPLQVRLTLDDLLHSGRSWLLADLIAQRPRASLPAFEVARNCGFRFDGHCDVDLPPHRNGFVLRAYAGRGQYLQELAGSPLRLDGEGYAHLQQICRVGLGRRGRLTGLTGHQLRGWAEGNIPLQLCLDDGPLILPIAPYETLHSGRWAIQLDLPASVCDGDVHLLQLQTTAGETIDERVEIVPFQLTPWAALLEHGQAPFPDHLSPISRERHRSLLGWLELADSSGQPLPAQLPLWQRLLSHPLRRDGEGNALPHGSEPGPDGAPVPRPPLHLPLSDAPVVSIVIPIHGQHAVTRRCLAAIAYAPTTVPYEVILVLDGTPYGPGTEASLMGKPALHAAEPDFELEVPGVRIVRHDFPRGFNQACCSGASVARGTYIVLLNNDTEPCAHWLEELLAPFKYWPDTGLVGAQLLFPNGRLQEAGGIVWGNGEPWNYGRGDNPYDPRYSYSRQIDYASGAALAISTALWRQVGGFSPEFSPAYYEDTDLAFKVRQAGRTVRYAPLARVIHHEGISNGTDTEADDCFKRYQAINAPLFNRKWSHVFDGPKEPNISDVDHVKDRGIIGRALFIDHDTPRPDRDAGSHAALVEMELLQALGWKVSFIPANLAWLGSYTEELQRRGIEVLHAPFVLSMENLLRERGSEFELIYVTRYSVATIALPHIFRYAEQARILFCNADLHYMRELRSARAHALSGKAAEQAIAHILEVQRQELEVIRQVHLTFSYSEVERAVIEAETLGSAPTATCPWVVQAPDRPAPLEGRSGVAFLGSYGHTPNREAVQLFLNEVWPDLQRRSPQLQFHIYGSGMPASLSESWGKVSGVVLEGWVADPASVYARHRLCLAPLRSGAGLKGKVAAAAAHGIPQILSPVAAEATGLRHGQEIWIARRPEEWIEAIEHLSTNDTLWQQMSEAAHRYACTTWSRERGLQLMAEALQRLDLPVQWKQPHPAATAT